MDESEDFESCKPKNNEQKESLFEHPGLYPSLSTWRTTTSVEGLELSENIEFVDISVSRTSGAQLTGHIGSFEGSCTRTDTQGAPLSAEI